MINPDHLARFNEEQLTSALKPLLVHDSWPYFEEYLRREQAKQVNITMRATDTSNINRGQGSYQEITKLLALKSKLLMDS